MNLLTMEHITKAYTDRVLLNDVAFSINENEKIGVIGINGWEVYAVKSDCRNRTI